MSADESATQLYDLLATSCIVLPLGPLEQHSGLGLSLDGLTVQTLLLGLLCVVSQP